MKQSTAVLIISILRLLVTGLAIAGAVYLADQGKSGWGWLIFVGLCLGYFDTAFTSD